MDEQWKHEEKSSQNYLCVAVVGPSLLRVYSREVLTAESDELQGSRHLGVSR